MILSKLMKYQSNTAVRDKYKLKLPDLNLETFLKPVSNNA